MQVRVQNKGKIVWKSRYDGDVSDTYCIVAIEDKKMGFISYHDCFEKSVVIRDLFIFLAS